MRGIETFFYFGKVREKRKRGKEERVKFVGNGPDHIENSLMGGTSSGP